MVWAARHYFYLQANTSETCRTAAPPEDGDQCCHASWEPAGKHCCYCHGNLGSATVADTRIVFGVFDMGQGELGAAALGCIMCGVVMPHTRRTRLVTDAWQDRFFRERAAAERDRSRSWCAHRVQALQRRQNTGHRCFHQPIGVATATTAHTTTRRRPPDRI